MFSLNRYAPQFHPDHTPSTSIQVQGQLPNPLSIADAQRLSIELKRVLGRDWPFAAPGDGADIPQPEPPAPPSDGEAAPNSGLGQAGTDTDTPETSAPSNLTEMTKAERKEELGGMKKAELIDLAEQHDVPITSDMNKAEIASAVNKQLTEEAKTGTE